MDCRSCGAKLNPNDRFCAYCGNLTPYGEKQDLEKQWEEERIKREKEKKEREESERALRKQEEQAYRRKARWEFLKAFATRVTTLVVLFIAILIAIGIVLLIGALLVGFGGFLLDMLVNIIAAIDASRLKIGERAELKFPAVPDAKVNAIVTAFPSAARITSRGAAVLDAEIRINNPPENILPGYSFSGFIVEIGRAHV